MPYRLVDPNRSPRLRTLLHIVGGTATGILLVGVLGLLAQTASLSAVIRDTQVANTQRSEDTKTAAQEAARSAQRIEDCTTPGRSCFDDAQKRLGRTVGTINRYALAAAACADQPQAQAVEEIQRCIIQLIDQDKRP